MYISLTSIICIELKCLIRSRVTYLLLLFTTLLTFLIILSYGKVRLTFILASLIPITSSTITIGYTTIKQMFHTLILIGAPRRYLRISLIIISLMYSIPYSLPYIAVSISSVVYALLIVMVTYNLTLNLFLRGVRREIERMI